MRVVDERTALVRDAARRSSTRTSATTLALALAAGVLLVTANGTLRAHPRAATRARLGVDVERQCPAERIVAAGCLNEDMVTCAPHANETLAMGGGGRRRARRVHHPRPRADALSRARRHAGDEVVRF